MQVLSTPQAAVRLRGIHKRFGAVHANDAVDLEVAAGTIHGLVGENGAGKSTLMSVLYGLYAPDAGAIEVFGQSAKMTGPHQAIALGVGMVHQHFMLVDTLTALENVMLGAEPSWSLRQADALVRPKLEALMASTGLRVDLDARIADLTVGDRQRLEILKALYRGAKLLVLDEPTAVLTPPEAEQLFQVLRTLRQQGTAVILITHKLDEVMGLCDRVTVMRGGRVVHECAVAETSAAQLAEAMVGRKVNIGRPREAGSAPGEVVLAAKGLVVRDALGVARLKGVDLTLRQGEIVGVAGVAGNGQSALLDALSGLAIPEAGELRVASESFLPGRWMDPQAARRLHMAHIPEDRLARALVADFPAWETAVLGYEDLYAQRGFLDRKRMRSETAQLMEKFDVRPRAITVRSGGLSGGNQQKLVIGRELGQAPRILLVGQPTRGVDIGAIEFIHARLRELRAQGCAILVVSSELEEILALADRVVVMNGGRITGELPIAECSESRLGVLMTAGPADGARAAA